MTLPRRIEAMDGRGRQLWRDLHKPGVVRDAATDALIEEACRIADRLDVLDAMIRDKTGDWLSFRDAVGVEVTVVVDNLLLEARQQASTLRALLGPLTVATKVATAPAPPVSAADEIAQRRASRHSSAATS